MRKRRGIALILVLTMVITCFATVKFTGTSEIDDSSAASKIASDAVGSSLVASGLKAIQSGSVGTVSNPYDIVEVVPYKGMAQMGYMVKGEEPVDVSKFTVESEELNRFAVSGSNSLLKFESELRRKSELDPTDDPTKWNAKTETKSGYYQKVAAGKGKYKQTISLSDVSRVPIYPASIFNAAQNEVTTAFDSMDQISTAENPVKTEIEEYVAPTEDQTKNNYIVKDFIARASGSSYVVDEENTSNDEYIFRYATPEEIASLGVLTYKAFSCDEVLAFYDNKAALYAENVTAGGSTDVVCYPTYKINEEGKYVFTDDIDGTNYVIFVPATDGTGEYILDRVRPAAADKKNINISLCYNEVPVAYYNKVNATAKQYIITNSYTKDIIEDEGVVSNITYGSSNVTFVKDTKSEGVARYKAVTGEAVNTYFEAIKASIGEDNPDYYVAPTYWKHLNYYVYFNPDEFTDAELTDLDPQYVVFVPDENGIYVVSNATEDVTGDETKLNLANAYQSNLGFANVKSNGNYKIIVNDATYDMVDDGTGNYAWIDATVPADAVVDHLSGKIWVKGKTFNYYSQSGYSNNDYFKKKILGIMEDKADSFIVKVHVVTPNELSSDTSLVDTADLIVISDNMNDTYLKDRVYLWEQNGRDKTGSKNLVNKSGSTLSYANENNAKKTMAFYNNDLNWNAVLKIFKRAAGVDNNYVPIIMDSHIFTETLKGDSGNYAQFKNAGWKLKTPYRSKYYGTGTQLPSSINNVYKLYLMLNMCDNPLRVYNRYINEFDFSGDTFGNKVTRTSATKDSIIQADIGSTIGGVTKTGRHVYDTNKTDELTMYWNQTTLISAENNNDDVLNRLKVDGVNDLYCTAISTKNNNTFPKSQVIYNVLTICADNGFVVSGKMSNAFDEFKTTTLSDAMKYDKEMNTYLSSNGMNSSNRTHILKYLTLYNFFNEMNDKQKISILDIEPCRVFLRTAKDYRKFLPYYAGQITLTQWHMLEFNCKVNDLNTDFDIIMLGTDYKDASNKERLRMEFWDSKLNGKIYLHVGDGAQNIQGYMQLHTYVDTPSGRRSFDLKDGTQRYNGNDMTHLKMTYLNEYLNANYAVILSDYLYNLDTSKIDDSSNIFKFAKDNKDKPNVFKYSDITVGSKESYKLANLSEFNKYAGNSKVTLKLTSNSIQPSTTVVERPTNQRTINIEYSVYDVSAKADDTYTVAFYSDNNADGKYAEKEKLAEDTGNKASQYVTGTYKISRDLKDDFCGVVHWILVVTKDKQPSVRTQLEGYLEIRKNTGDGSREKIRILQINSYNGNKTRVYFNGKPYDIGASCDKSTWNLRNDYTNTGKKLYKYTTAENLKDYELDITTVNQNNVPEFESWYKTNASGTVTVQWCNAGNHIVANCDKYSYNSKNYCLRCDKTKTHAATYQVVNKNIAAYNKDDPSTDRLKDYDMIIYGFGDCCHDIDNTYGAFDNIINFIDSGKSILFSHDCTSYYQNNGQTPSVVMSSGNFWGLYANNMLRDRAGMNRYAVPTIERLRGGYTDPAGKYVDKATTFSSHGADWWSDNGKEYIGIHGYGDFCIIYNNSNKMMQVGKVTNTARDTTLISKVNDGQITKYPFDLGSRTDNLSVANTHFQYYALDLEDPDLVVWYCLAKTSGSTNMDHYYDAARNDGRSNYYIYSIRNVLYTGAGHSTVGNVDDEVKLFVNTMVAAYNARIKKPEIIVENEDSRRKDDTIDQSILYYYTDLGSAPDSAAISSGLTYDVFFNPQDYNLISDVLRVKVFNQDGGKATDVVIKEISDSGTEGSTMTYGADGYIKMRSGHHYVFKFPLVRLNGSDGIYTYSMDIINAEDVQSTKKITMGARTLFNIH